MRIVVAMSGGVDSSTVAGLLHEAGHEVIGVTLQLYDHGAATGRKGACCAGQDIHDARRVADHLGIPHYVIDAEQRFADAVIGDFADSYAAGETPVPCVRCNQTVKFTDLTALARGLGCGAAGDWPLCAADRWAGRPGIASRGRSARATRAGSCSPPRASSLRSRCFRWARWRTSRRCAREAERLGLPVAAKPDSQDICFVASGHYAEPWSRLRPDAGEPGEIVSRDGRVLGRHDGIARYTVGQGKRLGAASRRSRRATGGGGA